MSTQNSTSTQTEDSLAAFGANEWVVEEIYQQYLADPASVDPAWHEFFADYKPNGGGAMAGGSSGNGTAAPAADRAPSSNGSVPTPATLAAKTGPKPAPPRGTPAASAPKPGPAAPAAPAASAPPAARPAPPRGTSPAPAKSAPAPAKAAPAPAKPAASASASKPAAAETATEKPEKTGPETRTIRGAAARIVQNMEASLEVPTATSVRAVPAKLVADNRIVINSNLARSRGGKVSFTHLIGWAQVKAAIDHPEMNNSYLEVDGKPALVIPDHVNLGLAIDLQQKDGSRSLVVASIKKCETMDFSQFWQAYEDIVRRARNGKLTTDDFAGTTISLTNPGGIGTVHSMPRLTKGQGAIIGVGAMEYPAEFSGLSEEQLAAAAISKVITLTSTYDHRIIQGAQSGEFLKRMHQLLLGSDGFYDEIFASLRIPYEPVRWVRDVTTVHEGEIDKTSRILELIHSYRVRGHLMADTDPLEYRQRRHADLDILEHGLTLWDLDRSFPVGGFSGQKTMKLREILGVLRDSYCRRVGVEYMHIQDPAERAWIAKRVEVKHAKPDTETQKRILSKLNEAEAFETFLQTKFVGQKRFSLEGAEAVIPLLDEVLQASAEEDLDELVIGMSHRGRLNVLTNIVGKPYEKVFNEFEGNMDPESTQGSGDVKYHLGAESKYTTPDGQHTITVSLTSNPSHLEAVNPVLEGIVRAKQDVLDKGLEGFTVLPVLLHGDAAFAGQGVVAETLNLSQLRGYRTGGTVHVVVNNQVGFTTAPAYSRSSFYSTDVARMIQAPIFHVNGDDPEACVRVARLAFAYRQAFHKDVVIDLVCYRRRGHNEGDDPSMSNPEMYAIIDNKRSVRKLYTEALIGRGDITVDEAEEALKDFQGKLEQVFRATKDSTQTARREPTLQSNPSSQVVETAVPLSLIHRVGDAHVEYPEGFHPHARVKPLMERRRKMSREGNVDWAFGEILALGTLVAEGRIVRLAGQDSRRGTFVQRHSVLIDKENGSEFTPLDLLGARNNQGTGRFFVHDSLLSEYAAMGFEYGYSLAMPDALVLWEAQFGDFVNGAQTVIDEFVSSGEAKWGQRSGVGLLLPHGQEGQGPDHSSGRIERFLQMCAEDNMTVVDCTTPANWFHLLRRQALSGLHRPLIAFTPKSLLRHRAAVSSLEEFTDGSRFQPVIDDPGVDGVKPDPAKVKRVLLCSGKLYYDLAAARAQRQLDDVAIIRLEQLYPLPVEEARSVLGRYPNAEDHVWVQEEAANQGAWSFVALNLLEQLEGIRLRRVSRKAAASPAVGSAKVHEQEQKALIEAALPTQR
ncbi:multifunctional oxoglutarate decarboxylase/oxoglutarate dehydrogenase thiamine pyrophosphate-binding subunit/dihydrolipoyllysine-residue succinyltransferase subunit [Cryptosporangium sp. NPDC051539]|uniref:multifunctional oxoglutarate decarboxylase/oxoglutarate dehydrogenase thiamine pyrophosphate-binding subunit/dihydrolipoyllysine-residue succinyltransferase subunit n=1 Tax=Cryptosporangium sp. NPDC051539 TaxID=3363962 RepID=UPI0037B42025